MLLALDVGNTNIVIGVYRGEELLVHWRVSTDRNRTADEFAVFLRDLFSFNDIRFDDIHDIVVSTVVPPLKPSLVSLSRRYFGVNPLVVDEGVRTGMPILYENPHEVGADRIVNAVAAYARYGGPVVVVDFGTATTFDVVSAAGEWLGGAIAPGISVSTEALFERTAKLPRVDLATPRRAIGKNTAESMRSGIIFGFVGQVDGVVRRIQRELGRDAFVVATGGLADLVAVESETIQKVDHLLTLEGLRMIHGLNRDHDRGRREAR